MQTRGGEYMPSTTCYLKDTDGTEYWFLWSTIVDAPTTFGMTEKEYEQDYLYQFGQRSKLDLEQAMVRARQKGCGFFGTTSLDDLMNGRNHAGKGGQRLTKEEIIEWYLRKKEDPPHIEREVDIFGNEDEE